MHIRFIHIKPHALLFHISSSSSALIRAGCGFGNRLRCRRWRCRLLSFHFFSPGFIGLLLLFRFRFSLSSSSSSVLPSFCSPWLLFSCCLGGKETFRGSPLLGAERGPLPCFGTGPTAARVVLLQEETGGSGDSTGTAAQTGSCGHTATARLSWLHLGNWVCDLAVLGKDFQRGWRLQPRGLGATEVSPPVLIESRLKAVAVTCPSGAAPETLQPPPGGARNPHTPILRRRKQKPAGVST